MSTAYLKESALPPSYYEASVAPRVEYPTLKGEVSTDICIVGAGLAGLHTALNLLERGYQVTLIEARRVGWGASGRNGGHVIPEFACGMRTLEIELGLEAARQCWKLARSGADALRARIKQYNIDCDYQAGHIEAAISEKHVAHLLEWQQRAAKHYDHHPQIISRDEMHQYVGSKGYLGALLDMNGGHLHPLKLSLGLARAVLAAGGEIYENSAVKSWVDGSRVRVQCEHGEVDASRLVLCSNVGMESIAGTQPKKLAKRILPAGTWIIATEPLSQALATSVLPTRAAVADNRVILDYFRLSADNRMVFGGGCSYTGQKTPAGFAQSLQQGMVKVFPQLADSKIEYAWGGIIDISMSRAPDFGKVINPQGNVFYAQGFSGSGLVATCVAGRVLAEAIAGDSQNLNLLMRLRHRPFPGGRWLRGPLTAIGMMYHRLRDIT